MHYTDTILGQIIKSKTNYSPQVLHPIARSIARQDISKELSNVESGWDDWVHYELAWCNANGCPQIGILIISIPWDSPFIIESKSLKLYLNSLTFTKFNNRQELLTTIKNDLEKTINAKLNLKLFDVADWITAQPKKPNNQSFIIDDCLTSYEETNNITKDFLSCEKKASQETLISNNFRSNCPVTGQPDWATIIITYKGPTILKPGLYKYLLSYRKHKGFHEQCIEMIFADIMAKCKPTTLEVRGYFTRRGGLDINPIRSTAKHKTSPSLQIQSRQ